MTVHKEMRFCRHCEDGQDEVPYGYEYWLCSKCGKANSVNFADEAEPGEDYL